MYDWGQWGPRAALVLVLFVPFALWRFGRERPSRAGTQILVWGMMWLPEAAAFDFPALPPLDKFSISASCALFGVFLWAGPRFRAARIGRGYDLLALLMMAGQIGTVLNNGEPLSYGMWTTVHLPAFTAYDGLSAAVRDFLDVCVPCALGRALIRTRRDLRSVLEVFVVAGLVYSIPILYELRMSPTLHLKLYGFDSRSDWSQNIRLGGYRPTVFMGHGLVVGFFMFLSTISAVTLHKAGQRKLLGRLRMKYVIGYLFVMLVLVKATAALLYAIFVWVLMRWFSVKAQVRVMLFFALIVVSYPFSRITDIFPTESLLSAAQSFGEDRMQSMQFRFDNEDILVFKGMEQPVFGWGGFARERVYDADTGKDLVVQDGAWIAIFGTHGIWGFTCYYAVLLLPIVQLARSLKRVTNRESRTLLAGLGFMVTVCCVNTLPNMNLPNLQFFFAAGLATLAVELSRTVRARSALNVAKPRTSQVAPAPSPALGDPA